MRFIPRMVADAGVPPSDLIASRAPMARPRIATALVVYKKSAWEQHLAKKGGRIRDAETRRSLLRSHRENLAAIEAVKKALESAKIRFRVTSRTDLHPARPGNEPDLFVSVGGDGTFLETSHQVRRGRILGVNSSPEHSVGFFCAATRQSFARVLARALDGELPAILLHRLEVRLRGRILPHLALNDVLVTPTNPGATARYTLRVGRVKEPHRSSGVWISTAAGSTAGIRAAGGALLPLASDRMQWAVRELYVPPGEKKPKLRKGVLPRDTEIRVVSTMLDGAIFVDGPRHRYPLSLGDEVWVRVSRAPLAALGLDAARGR